MYGELRETMEQLDGNLDKKGLKSRVQEQFGPAADDYTTSDVHARGESLGLLIRLVRAAAGWKMLDVATGAGHTALAFAPRVSHVVASDLTPAMLTKTWERAAAAGVINLETCLADAERLPFADASFDLLTCRLAFHHFPHPARALSEFARVLKPGGILGFTDNITVADAAAAEYYNAYEKLRDPSHHWVYSLASLEGKLAEAGFRVRDARTLTKEFEFHAWADRQRVSETIKQELLNRMDEIPDPLRPLFQPRHTEATMYFSLWEAVIVAVRHSTQRR